MAAPTFVAASTGATDATGAWSHTGATPGAAGRIMIFQLLNDGNTTLPDPVFTSATNIEDLAGTDNTWTEMVPGGVQVGSPGAAIGYAFIGRSLSSSAPTISGTSVSNEDLYMRMYEFQDVATGTTLATVIENGAGTHGTASSTAAAIVDREVVTNGTDRLAVQLIYVDDDNALAAFAGETGGDWTEPVAEYAESAGTDGCIGIQTAAMSSAGTIDGGTITMAASDPWGIIGFALIGTTAATEIFHEPILALQAVKRSNVY